MEKNIAAIEKIIVFLSNRDYNAKINSLSKAQRKQICIGNKTLSDYGGYTLSAETIEAIEVKHDYLDGKISEQVYKMWCLTWNLMRQ